MDRRIAISVAAVLAYAAGVALLSCAVVIGLRRGFTNYVPMTLVVVSALLMLASAYSIYILACGNCDPELGKYYITARLEQPGVNSVSISDRIGFRNCRVLETASGIKLSISPGSYVLHPGKMSRHKVSVRNRIAFRVKFSQPVDGMYFGIVLDRKLETNALLGSNLNDASSEEVIGRIVAIEPREGYIVLSMQSNFQEHAAEHILYTMATSEKLLSGEGMGFYRSFCYCVMGMAYPPSPSQDKLLVADSKQVFEAFPGAWLAMRDYGHVFRCVIGFSRKSWSDRIYDKVNTFKYFHESEIIFLERLLEYAGTYWVPKQELAAAQRSLTHMLVIMYAVLAPAKCKAFYRQDIISWLYDIMTTEMGRKECAIHVAMSVFGGARFRTTLLSSVYADLCSESGSRLKAMKSHMADLATIASDNVTREQIVDVMDRKGKEFFAVSTVIVPYFYKTKAHKEMLSIEGYGEVLACVKVGIKRFDKTMIDVLQGGTVLGDLSYHAGVKPFDVEEESFLEEYISRKGSKIYSMLERFQDLEYVCGSTKWKDPSILKFFIHLAVWMWDAKELSLRRKEKPPQEKTCSVRDMFRRYIHAYWSCYGVDVLMKKEDYLTPVNSMFEDSIRVNFRVVPFKDSLRVSRGILTDTVCRCVYNCTGGQLALGS